MSIYFVCVHKNTNFKLNFNFHFPLENQFYQFVLFHFMHTHTFMNSYMYVGRVMFMFLFIGKLKAWIRVTMTYIIWKLSSALFLLLNSIYAFIYLLFISFPFYDCPCTSIRYLYLWFVFSFISCHLFIIELLFFSFFPLFFPVGN